MKRLARTMGGWIPCCMKEVPCAWYSGLLVLLMLDVTLDTRQWGVSAEQVFHRRFHDDQALLNPPVRHFEVKTVDMALYYLQRYGYINITRCRKAVGETTLDLHRRSIEDTTQWRPIATDSFSTSPDVDLFTTTSPSTEGTTSTTGGVSSSVSTDGSSTVTSTVTSESGPTTPSPESYTRPTSRSVILAALTNNLDLSTTTGTETSSQAESATSTMLSVDSGTTTDGGERSSMSTMSSIAWTFPAATLEPGSGEIPTQDDLVVVRSSDPESDQDIAFCPREAVIQGLRHYQKAYRLQQTGVVDEETIQSMNQRRCGNQDISIEKTLEEEEQVAVPADTTPVSTRRKRRAREILERRQELRNRVIEERGTRNRPQDNVYLLEGMHIHPSSLVFQDGEQNSLVGSSMARRRQQLEEIKDEIQQQNITKRKPRDVAPIRKKRTTGGLGFNTNSDACLTWRILEYGFSTKMPIEDQKSVLKLGFRMWSEVIPVQFCMDEEHDIHDVDIQISFARGDHMNCNIPFDGDGGDLAHSWLQGNIHFDDAEEYTRSMRMDQSGIVLLRVAVHEIGHVLGLDHVAREYSIMYSKYPNYTAQLELDWEDRKDAQAIYGCCKGAFSIVFDWIHRQGDGYVFNTYMFRRQHYWMYENRFNRTRYGDPQRINHEWDPRLVNADTYAQAFYQVGDHTYVSDAFFFKGNYYYRFDDMSNRVEPGFPRRISEDWGPGSNSNSSNDRIPSNLDSAYFHPADKHMYFFKGNTVWVIDYPTWRYNVNHGCCDLIANFQDLFPAAPGHPDDPVLTGNVDTVYYARFNYKQYFFKGEEYWENVGLSRGVNSLVYRGYWWDKWFDICEVL